MTFPSCTGQLVVKLGLDLSSDPLCPSLPTTPQSLEFALCGTKQRFSGFVGEGLGYSQK